MQIHVTIELPASPDVVWAYLRQIDRHVEWMVDAASIGFETDQREGLGTRFTCLTELGPFHTRDQLEVTEWIDEQVIGIRHQGIVRGTGRFTLDPVGDSTRFSWAEELHIPIWLGGRLAEMGLRPVLQSVWRRNLRNLRDVITRQIDERIGLADRHPGALIGSGRRSEIREFGADAVICIGHRGASMAHEAEVLQLVSDAGYPCPRPLALLDENSLVMERVDGPTMLAELTTKPWLVPRRAKMLADLHRRLGEIEAPSSWPSVGPGGSIVHLGLHPDNVKMTKSGPVVIDWSSAARGSTDLDAALTYVVLLTGRVVGNSMIKGAVASFRKTFAAAFLKAMGSEAVLAHITEAAELRLLDPNLFAAERDAVFALGRGDLQ